MYLCVCNYVIIHEKLKTYFFTHVCMHINYQDASYVMHWIYMIIGSRTTA